MFLLVRLVSFNWDLFVWKVLVRCSCNGKFFFLIIKLLGCLGDISG